MLARRRTLVRTPIGSHARTPARRQGSRVGGPTSPGRTANGPDDGERSGRSSGRLTKTASDQRKQGVSRARTRGKHFPGGATGRDSPESRGRGPKKISAHLPAVLWSRAGSLARKASFRSGGGVAFGLLERRGGNAPRTNGESSPGRSRVEATDLRLVSEPPRVGHTGRRARRLRAPTRSTKIGVVPAVPVEPTLRVVAAPAPGRARSLRTKHRAQRGYEVSARW